MDGVICFGGEDWWYHNRGHYDMQMMRRLSGAMPVLYVNSLGMRTPSPGEGRMFLNRVRRKLRSVRRGLVRVDDNLAVFSPLMLPGRVGIAISRPLVRRLVRAAARRQGIRHPLVWVACPTGAEVVDELGAKAVVYQRTDRYECFRGVNARRIERYDGWLKARADLTVFCSGSLYESEAEDCRSACLVDHGVDLVRFASVSAGASWEPLDVLELPRPRVGFVGGIDAHTFDPNLFLGVAKRLPEAHFVLVGDCSLPRGWCNLPNVSSLGQRPYESVPDYMAACDVLIMPWNRSRWIEACNPVKLKEYLAAGRPIVSTPFPELCRYDGAVRIAAGADDFAEAIRAALAEPGDAGARRRLVRNQSWSIKAAEILDALADRGVAAPGRAGQSAPAAAPAFTPIPMPALIAEPAAPAPAPTVTVVAAPLSQPPHIAACILLAGGLRPSPLVAAAGRSVLDLWLTPHGSVLDDWCERVAEVAAEVGRVIPIRVVHDAVVPPPWPGYDRGQPITIEQDPTALRGPAGVVRDVCRDYAPDQHVLVVEAARYLSGSLVPMLDEHVAQGADATVGANPDGAPSGLYLIRCGALDLVPAVGFVDLKEQWLRRTVDAALNVRVHRMDGNGALPLRSRRQVLVAAAAANGIAREPLHEVAPGAPELFAGLRVICNGCLIGPGATVIDSIVMPGAIVGTDAVIVRSLVIPGCRVGPRTDIVDAVAQAGKCLPDPLVGTGA